MGRGMGVLRLVLALALVSALAGCSIVRSQSSKRVSGEYVDPSAFDRIKKGHSTGAFVEATLGAPTTRTSMEDGTELWTWRSKEHKEGSGSVFLLFSGQSEREVIRTSNVQLRDGIVEEKWRD